VTVISLNQGGSSLEETRWPRLRTITVVRADASAATELAAFDAALLAAGLGNFNLVYLSSVIPPGTEVMTLPGRADVAGDWGDRLYVVVAEQRVDRPGREAWAGVGWVQHEETGRGLFVEHHGHSEDAVRGDIERSLAAMVHARPGTAFGPVQSVVHGITCEGDPVCALVAAVYEAEGWTLDMRGR
jgi:arginine decarboxylase